ncbi:hypothetical protein CSC3H3_21530 (plasmid) [Thalassospira marina]|uniref:Sigma-54 factor interaction domain-containing protein n=2 Tax=Thalassospira marina TaxID=2048283 RepID=A0A2N3KMS1_9PROT|nr:hypothetical protein CSC3H3_21530 [Thalassospira marina]PKR51844.1 hypothetical protein COO20_18575 [Thalassospira marina]
MNMIDQFNMRDHFVSLCNLVNQTRLDGVLVQSGELIANMTGGRIALIYLLDATGRNLVLSGGYAHGFSTWAPGSLVHPLQGGGGSPVCPLTQVAFTGKTLCLDNGMAGYDISPVTKAIDGLSLPTHMAVLPLARANADFLGVAVVLADGAIAPWLDRSVTRQILRAVSSSIETRQVVAGQENEKAMLEKSLARAEGDRMSLRRRVTGRLSKRLIGRSRPMQILREKVAHLAGKTGPVMILGDDGVGKEKVARAMHEHSIQSSAPFVYVNCASLSADIFAPELFGHKRGAIKGVASARKGLLRKAGNGVLYLDGIDRLCGPSQEMLLRLLETRQYRPLGSERDMELSARIIVSARSDLSVRAQEGAFLPGLYYRLRETTVTVPSLGECREDIGDIVHAVLAGIEREEKRHLKLHPTAFAFLSQRPFAGDRRELEGLTRLAASDAEDGTMLTVAHFQAVDAAAMPENASSPGVLPLPEAMAMFEQDLITRALAQTDGNRTTAAQMLGVPKRTLADKCKKYGL